MASRTRLGDSGRNGTRTPKALNTALPTAAAVGNAVFNALGVRVPFLPLTPKRVLDALAKGGKI